MEAARELLEEAEKVLGSPVCERTGLLRIAVTEEQKEHYRKRAEEDSEALWVEEVRKRVPEAAAASGIWVQNAVTVYSPSYLEGLWRSAEKAGAERAPFSVKTLAELDSFDAIVLAAGAGILEFKEGCGLPLKKTKGQALLCRWPKEKLGPLPCSLLSQGHITPTADPEVCQIGSTYERTFSSAGPDPKIALLLLEKAALFYPPARDFEVLEIRSGIRISPSLGYRPLAVPISPKTWVFTGLGSRGMLYHALLGKELAKEIVDRLSF
jgi:glycine/D-amino acid oxidase-like deaminating enzyme